MTLTKEKMYLLASGQIKDSSDCRAAGYSASDCRAAGYSLSACRAAGYSASDCRAAGYSASACRAAGYSASACRASDCRAAGYSASDCRAAGYSASDCRAAGYSASEIEALDVEIPKLEKPYSKLLEEIRAKKRKHDQSTFGPDTDPEAELCGTRMCTAGHLVNMAGEAGYKLKAKYGFIGAASLLHEKAHPGELPQNFGNIPQEWAMAYIETMAEKEQAAST